MTGPIRVRSTLHAVRHPRSRGQALVEFALILPVMALLLLAAVDFGRVFFTYIEVNNAAREGAAYAAGNPTDTAGISSHAVQETNVQGQGGENPITVSASCADTNGNVLDCATAAGGAGTGNTVTVAVQEKFDFLTPLIGGIVGADFHVSADATAAVLGLAPGADASLPPGCSIPVATFTVTIATRTVTLDASASSPSSGQCAISGYNWTMGDGADPFPPIVGKTATYTYAADGTYTIALEVTNQAGNGASTQTITIGLPGPTPTPSPTATATATPAPTATSTPAPVCNTVPSFTWQSDKNKTVTFQGSYTGQPAPDQWSWNFGDGYSDSTQNVSHTYGNGSDKTVTLTVTNGTCVKSTTKTVKP